ncbi:MAG: hypothetical protein EP346_07225 [Bacteroidetes bacterium]|nr:MAG: hypothetical protein EP346_07225 [Bacteroidota bacterium]
MKRQILSIVLLIAFAAPAAVSYLYLKSRQRVVKREVKRMMLAGMDESELVHLSFSKREAEDLKWEHATEFEWNQTMYDVVRSSNQGDSVYYVCYRDEAESKLKRQLATLLIDIHKKDPTQQDQLVLIKDFYSSLYKDNFTVQFTQPLSLSSTHNTAYAMHLSSGHINICSPPPLFVATCQS